MNASASASTPASTTTSGSCSTPPWHQDGTASADTNHPDGANPNQCGHVGLDIALHLRPDRHPHRSSQVPRAARCLHLLRLCAVPGAMDMLSHRDRANVQSLCGLHRRETSIPDVDAGRIADAEADYGGADVFLHGVVVCEAESSDAVSEAA